MDTHIIHRDRFPLLAFILVAIATTLAPACEAIDDDAISPPENVVDDGAGDDNAAATTAPVAAARSLTQRLCLGVRGVDAHGPGAGAEVYYCSNLAGGDPGRDNQWYFATTGSGYWYIKNRVSGLCLGVRGVDSHGPGAGAEVYYCNPGGGDAGLDNQWYFEGLSGGWYHIRNRVSGLCLGVRGVDSHGPGADAEVYYCNPGGGDAGLDNLWSLGTAPDGFAYIFNYF